MEGPGAKDPNNKLVVLYRKMAELTAPECANSCRVPHSCCAIVYCQIAKHYALDRYGVTLKPEEPCATNPKRLPYMGPEGCTVAPHLRPLCAVHTCAINGLGCKPGDPTWTKDYFKLRRAIDRLEAEEA